MSEEQSITPSYYKNGGLEAIDVIEAFNLSFSLGNVLKYVIRAGKKGNQLEDLRKAQWYLRRHIAAVEADVWGRDKKGG